MGRLDIRKLTCYIFAFIIIIFNENQVNRILVKLIKL